MKTSVLLTRPEGENEVLAARLVNDGFDVTIRPMIRLSEVEVDSRLKEIAMNLDQYDHVIFVSKRAASVGAALLENYWPQWPAKLTWLAVGKGTAEVLTEYQVNALYPLLAGSEGLLGLPALTEVRGRKILIVRGNGGRELLAAALKERGALVEYFEVYRRDPVRYENWENSQAALIVIATSVEILESLTSQAGARVASMNILAASTRIAEHARQLAFCSVTIAAGASDQALYDAVLDLSENVGLS